MRQPGDRNHHESNKETISMIAHERIVSRAVLSGLLLLSCHTALETHAAFADEKGEKNAAVKPARKKLDIHRISTVSVLTPQLASRIDRMRKLYAMHEAGCIIVIMFARYRLEALARASEERGDGHYVSPMKKIAEEGGLRRLEAFQLLSPQQDWHRAWIIELPTLEAAEAWIEAEETLPHSIRARREFHLARIWSPEYFASWVRR